ncbi:MAG: cation-transporting P-type ATPase [Pseudomonadota bacterium]
MLGNRLTDLNKVDWHALAPGVALDRVSSDQEHGLSEELAGARLVETGPNTISARGGVRLVETLFRQFASPLVLILLVAAGLSVALGHRLDAAAIAAIIFVNAALGFAQEWRAQAAISALQQMMAPACRVLREGSVQTIDVQGLVPGDIVLLEAGDRIPGDLRLIACRKVIALGLLFTNLAKSPLDKFLS